MTTTDTTAIPAMLQSALRSVERERDEILSLIPIAHDVEEILGPHTSGHHVLDGRLEVHVQDPDGAIRSLSRRGYVLRGEPTRSDPHSVGIAFITWRLARRGEDKPRLAIYKAIYPESKGACRLVQVGTKTREEPVYELRCDSHADVLQGYAQAIQEREGGTV